MTEKEYRLIPVDSYSSIKVFIEDRKKYYKQFVLLEPVKDSSTDSTIFGGLVDCILFSPSEFEDRYVMSIAQVPTGQYLKFVEEMMRFTVLSLNEENQVTRELEVIMEDAYNAVKFDRAGTIVDFKRDSFEKVKEKFIGTDIELYYRQLRESYGKTVIELNTLNNAQNVVNELRCHANTRDIINLTTNEEIEVFDQLPLFGYIVLDSVQYPIKGLIDRIVVNHSLKRVHIYDLKTAWDNEGEFLTNYFKYKYYIQAAVYYRLVRLWVIMNKWNDYDVAYPAFIVAESNNYKAPLIYRTNYETMKQGVKGFTLKGKKYPGLLDAVTEMHWHKESGIWNISKTNHENRGIIDINPFV